LLLIRPEIHGRPATTAFGNSHAPNIAVEDKTMRGAASDSFGFLPWVTILLTALVVLAACYFATL
jgi:hypothetical protein